MWIVKLKKIADFEFSTFKLHDAKRITKSYQRLKSVFFDDLYKQVKKRRNYTSAFLIDTVTGPDNQDWSNNSWYLVVSRDTNNLDVWLFIKQEPDASGWVVGVGPDAFVEYIQSKNDFPFNETVESILRSPKKWKKLVVLVN